jgi:hypothetical protein
MGDSIIARILKGHLGTITSAEKTYLKILIHAQHCITYSSQQLELDQILQDLNLTTTRPKAPSNPATSDSASTSNQKDDSYSKVFDRAPFKPTTTKDLPKKRKNFLDEIRDFHEKMIRAFGDNYSGHEQVSMLLKDAGDAVNNGAIFTQAISSPTKKAESTNSSYPLIVDLSDLNPEMFEILRLGTTTLNEKENTPVISLETAQQTLINGDINYWLSALKTYENFESPFYLNGDTLLDKLRNLEEITTEKDKQKLLRFMDATGIDESSYSQVLSAFNAMIQAQKEKPSEEIVTINDPEIQARIITDNLQINPVDNQTELNEVFLMLNETPPEYNPNNESIKAVEELFSNELKSLPQGVNLQVKPLVLRNLVNRHFETQQVNKPNKPQDENQALLFRNFQTMISRFDRDVNNNYDERARETAIQNLRKNIINEDYTSTIGNPQEALAIIDLIAEPPYLGEQGLGFAQMVKESRNFDDLAERLTKAIEASPFQSSVKIPPFLLNSRQSTLLVLPSDLAGLRPKVTTDKEGNEETKNDFDTLKALGVYNEALFVNGSTELSVTPNPPSPTISSVLSEKLPRLNELLDIFIKDPNVKEQFIKSHLDGSGKFKENGATLAEAMRVMITDTINKPLNFVKKETGIDYYSKQMQDLNELVKFSNKYNLDLCVGYAVPNPKEKTDLINMFQNFTQFEPQVESQIEEIYSAYESEYSEDHVESDSTVSNFSDYDTWSQADLINLVTHLQSLIYSLDDSSTANLDLDIFHTRRGSGFFRPSFGLTDFLA